MDKQNYYDPEETETYSIKLSEASGEHPEESNGVFDRPAAYNARFRPKISIPGSQQQFPTIAGLRLKNVQRTPAVQRLWATRAGVCAYPTVRERFSRTELKGNTRTGAEIIVDETAQRNRRKCNNIDNTTSLTQYGYNKAKCQNRLYRRLSATRKQRRTSYYYCCVCGPTTCSMSFIVDHA